MREYPNIARLVLASSSPRRAELLASMGLDFEVRVPKVDEAAQPGEAPRAFAERLAGEKAEAVAVAPGEALIAADTIVALDGGLLGKPRDEAEALATLSRLSGRTHEVVTGVCVRAAGRGRVFSVLTEVEFGVLDRREIEAYIATGDPMDKAGAYAIQGGAAHMVRGIRGSYTNVVGLPLLEVHEALISL